MIFKAIILYSLRRLGAGLPFPGGFELEPEATGIGDNGGSEVATNESISIRLILLLICTLTFSFSACKICNQVSVKTMTLILKLAFVVLVALTGNCRKE